MNFCEQTNRSNLIGKKRYRVLCRVANFDYEINDCLKTSDPILLSEYNCKLMFPVEFQYLTSAENMADDSTGAFEMYIVNTKRIFTTRGNLKKNSISVCKVRVTKRVSCNETKSLLSNYCQFLKT